MLFAPAFRPPAVPLFTHTPYFSCWSRADKLTDKWPTHWSGAAQGMFGQILIDGNVYRWMGPNPNLENRKEIPAMEQTSLTVTATRSIYTFQAGGIELQVEFCSPLLVDDLELLARPCSYLTLTEKSIDGKPHKVRAYFDMSGEFVVGNNSDRVDARRLKAGGREFVSMKSVDHQPLSRSGDRVRCDWGALYLHGPGQTFFADDASARISFAEGKVPDDDDRLPRSVNDGWPVVGLQFDLTDKATIEVGYDEGYALEFFGRKLRPYWNRKNIGPLKMMNQAIDNFAAVHAKCEKMDQRVASEAGELGPDYAQALELAYRQCLAGHGLAEDFSAGLLFFPKENSSNGCIDTADVVFPASPFFLQYNTELLKAQVVPLMLYAESSRWPWHFAPHDLGQYPLANGQVYGGGEQTEEDQMPVEETANLLLMLAGIEQKEHDQKLIKQHFPLLTKWAKYLEAKGLDPENQLCTDDFSGHLAHNANLSIKAIVALRAYAELAESIGEKAEASKYKQLSETWAKQWPEMAKGGTPTVLAFGQPNTWSMKYNLMWDRLLGYNVFDPSIANSELDAYFAKANTYGTPLDNRADFTKTDWLFWAASLSRSKTEFSKFSGDVFKWLNETPSRVPFSDWYDTKTGKETGFEARTVIGGVAAPLLMHSWKRGLKS